VVAFLASDRDARAAVVGAGAITRLVELLNTSSMEVARCASGALTNLVESAANVNEIAILGRRAITTLVALLESRIEEVQKQAAASLRRLSNTIPNQIAIASAGGIVRLLTLVSASSGATRVDAAAALANVSEIPANSVAIAEAGGISTAVALMLSASIDLQTSGACVTHNMSALDSSVERIVSAGAAVPLSALLHSGQVQSQEYGSGALQNLSMHHVGRAALVHTDGIVRHLIALLDSKSTSASLASIFRSAGVLSNLGLSIEHLVAMVSADAIPHVVQVLMFAPNAAKVYAARALSSLSGSHAIVIISAGALAPLIDLLRCSASVSVLEAAADALFHLSAVPEHRAALARAGAIPAVIGLLLVSQSPLVQRSAAGALHFLSFDHAVAIASDEGTLPLASLLASAPAIIALQEHAAAALCNLSEHAADMVCHEIAGILDTLVTLACVHLAVIAGVRGGHTEHVLRSRCVHRAQDCGIWCDRASPCSSVVYIGEGTISGFTCPARHERVCSGSPRIAAKRCCGFTCVVCFTDVG
jgi:hypothetical protein